MKERPILFSGPMVRAILDGRKTQTRRVLQLQPTSPATIFDPGIDLPVWAIWPSEELDDAGHPKDHGVKCPYGRPGDRLWVREAFDLVDDPGARNKDVRKTEWDDEEKEHRRWCVDYMVDGGTRIMDRLPKGKGGRRWRSPIHMPRWASRITLEVTAVRVERLQAISDSDAFAEGLQSYVDSHRGRTGGDGSVRYTFAAMWDKINGKSHPWESNPWVWVVEFKPHKEKPCKSGERRS